MVTIIDSTSPSTIKAEHHERDEEDLYNEDEEYFSRAKRIAKQYIYEWTGILCIWDCSPIWIRFSKLCSFVIFDAFTEIFRPTSRYHKYVTETI